MGGHHTGWRLAALACAWLAGISIQLHEPSLWSGWMYLALCGVAMVLVGCAMRWRISLVWTCLGMAALGFGVTGCHARMHDRALLPGALERKDIELVGEVASLPQRDLFGLRFRFRVESARSGGAPVRTSPLVALGWYAGFGDTTTHDPLRESLRPGQRWRFTVRLRQPHGLSNPHGFDYELALFERGIGATGYVRSEPAPTLLGQAQGDAVDRWRDHVRRAIAEEVEDPRDAGVLAALSVGDQSAIDRSDWNLFRRTGVAHLVAISGLHIAMMAWLAAAATGAAWRRSRRLALRIPAPSAARWGGLAAAMAYGVFSGLGVPSQRTIWMLATVTLLHAGGRRWPWPLVLLAAAVAVTALDPWAMLQPGFWLSFVAVGLLMASSPAMPSGTAPTENARPAWQGGVRGMARAAIMGARTQALATVGLAPLTLVLFQQVSVVGFFANLIAIPAVTLLVAPLSLLGSALPVLWKPASWGMDALRWWLEWLQSWSGAVWSAPVAPLWAQAAGLLAAALAVLPLPWRLRALALPLALPLLWPHVDRPTEGEFDVLAADVGQGTSVLVRTAGHLLVFDAGPRYSPDSDAGERVLLPLLRTQGEERIDRLVLSHRDTDHIGGAQALLANTRVVDSRTSLEPGHPLQALLPRHEHCETGQSWTWEGVRFDMLQPPAQAYGDGLKSNAMSCVLHVQGAHGSLLLTGDIERPQEDWLVATRPGVLRSDVLIAPHHGSKTSSSPEFLDAVAPKVAIFQAGYLNRFGHPAESVLERYVRRGIAVAASPGCGAWSWRSDSPGLGVCQRDADRRYWHHRPMRFAARASAPCSGLDIANLRAEESCR